MDAAPDFAASGCDLLNRQIGTAVVGNAAFEHTAHKGAVFGMGCFEEAGAVHHAARLFFRVAVHHFSERGRGVHRFQPSVVVTAHQHGITVHLADTVQKMHPGFPVLIVGAGIEWKRAIHRDSPLCAAFIESLSIYHAAGIHASGKKIFVDIYRYNDI